MKDFHRRDRHFSLCGLNCRLCPMCLDGFCPGCGAGAGNQSCAIARCSLEQGGIEYCFQCKSYPCGRYAHFDDFDSFITHQRRSAHMEHFQTVGPEQYRQEQEDKAGLLKCLLTRCNAGRKKTFYCAAVNLLPLEDVRAVVDRTRPLSTVQDRERQAVDAFEALAKAQGMTLRLRKRPKTKTGKP